MFARPPMPITPTVIRSLAPGLPLAASTPPGMSMGAPAAKSDCDTKRRREMGWTDMDGVLGVKIFTSTATFPEGSAGRKVFEPPDGCRRPEAYSIPGFWTAELAVVSSLT